MAKVFLKDFRNTIDIELPESKLSIVLYTSLLIGEISQIKRKYPKLSDPKTIDAEDASYEMATKSIKSWELYDDNNKKVDISEEQVRLFTGIDYDFIWQNIKVSKETSKKKQLKK